MAKCNECKKELSVGKHKDIVDISFYDEADINEEGVLDSGVSGRSLVYHKKCFDEKFENKL